MSKFTLAVLTVALVAATAVGQGSAPTLRIVTEDPNLPSELFYGNIKVKPVRMRPGTNTPITINDADFFVSQHYVDFFARFPDQGGLGYWTNEITSCVNSPTPCSIIGRKVGVSAAFFIENEFQQSGYFVYKLFKGTLDRLPTYAEFKPDRRIIMSSASIAAGKTALAAAFVQRPAFVQKYQNATTRDTFVDAIIATVQQTSGVNIASQRNALLSQYDSGGRAAVISAVAEDASFSSAEYNRAFVAMQYWGYLNRDFDQGGYQFWLDVVNNRVTNNYRAMVCAFITSREYQERFGSSIFYTNSDCANIN
ncbi:MAG TPA: DUF4214 domain-containing protein [Pyrinomonadaceae bacterium]|jgi:hypothetical protein